MIRTYVHVDAKSFIATVVEEINQVYFRFQKFSFRSISLQLQKQLQLQLQLHLYLLGDFLFLLHERTG